MCVCACVCVYARACVCAYVCFINRKTLTDTSKFQYAGVLSIFPHDREEISRTARPAMTCSAIFLSIFQRDRETERSGKEDLSHRSSCYDVLCDFPFDISERARETKRETQRDRHRERSGKEDLSHRSSCYDALCDSPLDISCMQAADAQGSR